MGGDMGAMQAAPAAIWVYSSTIWGAGASFLRLVRSGFAACDRIVGWGGGGGPMKSW